MIDACIDAYQGQAVILVVRYHARLAWLRERMGKYRQHSFTSPPLAIETRYMLDSTISISHDARAQNMEAEGQAARVPAPAYDDGYI